MNLEDGRVQYFSLLAWEYWREQRQEGSGNRKRPWISERKKALKGESQERPGRKRSEGPKGSKASRELEL
jgi:hypothetical protein